MRELSITDKIKRLDMLLNEYKSIKIKEKTPSENLEKFNAVIDEFKKLKSVHRKSSFKQKPTISNFTKIIHEFEIAKNNVLPFRREEVKELIKQNPHKIRRSTFELMEHNFRENSHSNIHQYIFDYNYTGDVGVQLLYDFLKPIDNGQIKNLLEKLKERKYTVEREVSTGEGRIDLLIKDETNKFVIVIENKLLANISDKELEDEDGVIIAGTQLDNYKDYILKSNKFNGWDAMFMLLSYKEINDFKDDYFIFSNYDNLYRVLNKTDIKDNIIDEYKVLLYAIIKNINHDIRLKLSQNSDVETYDLAELSTINLYLS